MDSLSIIKIRGISKSFRASRSLSSIFLKKHYAGPIDALKKVYLSVRSGEVFVLIGPNGAGKTTLLKILSSLIIPDEGDAFLDGFSVVGQEKKTIAKFSLVVSEERSFYWRLSGYDNLRFFAILNNIKRSMIKEHIREVIDIVELENPNKMFQHYSAGNKQRLALARALLKGAPILFMDEPTKSLDPASQGKIQSIIKKSARVLRDRTFFIITHSLSEAESIADKIGILCGGELRAAGTMEELKASCGKPSASLKEIYDWYLTPAMSTT